MNNEAFNLLKRSQEQQAATARERQWQASRRQSGTMSSPPTQSEIDDLFSNRITPETDLPPMQPLFQMFSVPCFYRGELVADCGKAKSGKTFFLSILITACLTDKSLALERNIHTDNKCHSDLTELKPLRVLWIDTEQSQQSTQEILKHRIIPLTERSVYDLDETLFAFNLRGLGYEKRGKMTEVALRTIKPDLCIIDGIKDLMTDINDAVQATLLMEKLMSLAKELNCCIVCVLHLNKSEQDRNMRGSIGTELTNKAFEVFQCEKISDNDTFKVSHTYSRKQQMKQHLYYCVDTDGLPVCCPDYHEQPRDAKGRWMRVTVEPAQARDDIDLRKLFTTAMEGRQSRPFNEVMAIALKKCGVVDAKAYYAYLDQAVDEDVVRKVVHPETGATWVELVDNTLPF